MIGARPPVVLIGGQLCTERLWQDQLPALRALTEVVVAVPSDDDTIAAMAARLLRQLPPCFSVVAHAMGGFVAFEMLRRAPGRIHSLALLSTLAPADTPAQTSRREGYLRLVEAGNFTGVIEERIPILLHPDRRNDPALVDAVRTMAADTGPAAFLRQQRAIMTRKDSRPGLAAIRCPTLILFARHDGIVTREHQEEMLRAISGARFDIVEDCGHMMTLEKPELLAQMLSRWIASN